MPASLTARGESNALLPGIRNQTLSIALISMLGLFLELLIIRWISTEIRIFAYLQNTVLVVCFLGLGMGCFTCRQPIALPRTFAALAILTLLLTIPATHFAISQITPCLSLLNDLVIWQFDEQSDRLTAARRIAAGLAMTLLLMLLIWEMFLPVGRLLGRLMDRHPRTIVAYSSNIAGSLIGIGIFWLLSSLSTSPWVWFVVAALLCLPFLPAGGERLPSLVFIFVFVVAAGLANRDPQALAVVWSPYQKLALMDNKDALERGHAARSDKYIVMVNNAGYQAIIDLSEATVRNNPAIPHDRRGLSQYDLPLMFHPSPRRVLVVGAGTGNDVAGALRGGAKEVVAVEIDPAIIQMGRRYHPERPYDSPRVTIVNDDARSFFETSDRKFDLIIFGLLDSHTTTSMTNARLDHYVYTRESIARARSLLAPGGVIALSFEATKPYIADRMARCLQEEFAARPLHFRVPGDSLGWGGLMFLAGDRENITAGLASHPELARKIEQWRRDMPVELSYATEVATDDWPYLYLESRRIPGLYWLLAALMGAMALYCRCRLGPAVALSSWDKSRWHFFFLGAAFMLLEVQNISKAAVVLGNTWEVNAVIISGIMLMILLANLAAARWPNLSARVVHWGLIGSCLGLYFFDLASLNGLPYVAKTLTVGALTTLPMFFSGIVFIRSLAAVPRKDLALGANMIGALVGGMLQSATFVIGVRSLLLIVAVLYLAALLIRSGQPARGDKFTQPPEPLEPEEPEWEQDPTQGLETVAT